MTKQSELDEILNDIVAVTITLEGEPLDKALKVQKQALLDWHNKQIEAVIEATYDNLPSLDKLTVGNEMSDGYDQGVEAFRQAAIKAIYGKESN